MVTEGAEVERTIRPRIAAHTSRTEQESTAENIRVWSMTCFPARVHFTPALTMESVLLNRSFIELSAVALFKSQAT